MTTPIKSDSALRDELAIAADYLEDGGFSGAAEAVRVLYPRLPPSALVMRRVMTDLADGLLAECPYRLCVRSEPHLGIGDFLFVAVDRIARSREKYYDWFDLSVTVYGRIAFTAVSEMHVRRIEMWDATDCVISREPTTTHYVFTTGDVLNLTMDFRLASFLLPPETVAKFIESCVEN